LSQQNGCSLVYFRQGNTGGMEDKHLSVRSLKREVIKAVIVAVILTIGGTIWAIVKNLPGEISAKQGITNTLELYARDINQGKFDAHSYFASDVSRFFIVEKTDPRRINEWWQKNFYSTFSNMNVEFDFETLTIKQTEDGYSATVYLYSDYFNENEQKQYHRQKSRYDMKFDDEYRMTYLVQEVY
jgi:hypothetical protein